MTTDLKRITNLIESTLSVTALFGIMILSIGLVIVMNPQRELNSDGSVAGLDTNGGAILKYENHYDYSGHKSYVEEIGSNLNYSIVPKNLEKGELVIDLITFTNEFDRNVKFNLNTEVLGYILDVITLSLISDSGEEYILFPASNDLEVSIPSYSLKHYSLKFYTQKNINFPIEILLSFSF